MNTQLLRVALALAAVAPATATADVPPPGLAAEMRQDWTAAAAAYRQALADDPRDAALWERLADVEARRGDRLAAATALGHAAALRPRDAALQARHAHALAAAERPRLALAAMARALTIEPDNVEFLSSQAQLANWAGDYPLARASLARVLALRPDRAGIRADLARTVAWSGDPTRAIVLMRGYLQAHPDDAVARLDLARFLAWQGDYPGALDALQRLPSSVAAAEADALRARVLAWAGHPQQALSLNTPLLEPGPEDGDLDYTQAIALHQGYRPADALPFVARVAARQPTARATRELVESAGPDALSAMDTRLVHTADSDGIRIDRAGVDLKLALDPAWTLLGELGGARFRAPAGGPFITPMGARAIDETRVRGGLRYAVGPRVAIELLGGGSSAGGATRALAEAALLMRPADAWQWRLSLARDRIDASPRTIGAGLMRTGGTGALRWQPDLRWTLDLDARADRYSDGNHRHGLALAMRRATARLGWLNLDLGLAGEAFGFSRARGGGYYAPHQYRRAAFTAGAYLPLGRRAGLDVQLAAGQQKDDSMSHWHSANDIGADLFLRPAPHWQLQLHGGYAQRRQASGGYAGRAWSLWLQRTF